MRRAVELMRHELLCGGEYRVVNSRSVQNRTVREFTHSRRLRNNPNSFTYGPVKMIVYFQKGYRVKSRLAALVMLVLICIAAFASEAPWYKWKNNVDRTILCSQNSPGDAWDVYDGPYKESRCKQLGNPQ